MRIRKVIPAIRKSSLVFLMQFLCIVAIAGATDTVEDPKNCKVCSMDRTRFAHSRMLIVYNDGIRVGVCSIHCAAEDMYQNTARTVRSLLVADYQSKELINARTAFWVVGGKASGVMTVLAKWAFARHGDAERFAAEQGGTVASFDQVLVLASREVREQLAEEKAVEQEIQREQLQNMKYD